MYETAVVNTTHPLIYDINRFIALCCVLYYIYGHVCVAAPSGGPSQKCAGISTDFILFHLTKHFFYHDTLIIN